MKIKVVLLVIILLVTGCASRGDLVANLSQGETWGDFLFKETEEVLTGGTAYGGNTYVEAAIVTSSDSETIKLFPGLPGSKKLENFFFVWDPKSQKVEIFQEKPKK